MSYIMQAEPQATLNRNNPSIEVIILPTTTGDYIETNLNIFAEDNQVEFKFKSHALYYANFASNGI